MTKTLVNGLIQDDTSLQYEEGPFKLPERPASPTTITQTYATAATTVPAATQVTPPAGGTGAEAGAYDTSANRDLLIASVTAGAADLLALKKVVNSIIDSLQAAGIMA